MRTWRYRSAILSSLLSLLPLFAQATDCVDIRLDQPGSAFDKIPVYNQLDSRNVDANICYAIAGSQMIDEYRYRKGDLLHKLTSPLSLAIAYKEFSEDDVNKNYNLSEITNNNITGSILGGGFISETLQAAHRTDICDQNAIEARAGLLHKNSLPRQGFKSAQEFVESILLAQNSLNVKSFDKLDHLKFLKTQFHAQCQGHLFAIGEVPQESLDSGNYIEDLGRLMMMQKNALLNEDEKRALRIKFLKKYDKVALVSRFKSKINALLEKRIPVGIGYLMGVLQKKSGSSGFDAHASIIVGQRVNPKTRMCELLVRDSYGADCKDSRGDDRYALPCENGSVWVEADTLLRETSKITWIP